MSTPFRKKRRFKMNEMEKTLLVEALFWKHEGCAASREEIAELCDQLELDIEEEDMDEVVLALEDRL